jgi:ubiquinone/menaquinone biosynthesis C-methylase UbiE
MESSYPGKLRLWEAAALPLVQEAPPAVSADTGELVEPVSWPEPAAQLFAQEALHPTPPPTPPLGAEPYTLQWFLHIEQQRHGRQGRWIPRLLEFAKHAGETLLGLGDGLGTDWLQYARHGARVIVCSPCVAHLALVRRNFELRGLSGKFLHADPTCLPLPSASIDVACVTEILQRVAQPHQVVAELFRVLKPGGKVLAVVPARFDIDFWTRPRWLFWAGHWPQQRPFPEEERHTLRRFSARELRRLFAAFVEQRIRKRHLRRAEVPPLWRVLPLSLLERLFGRVLVLKAFKPLESVVALPAAA